MSTRPDSDPSPLLRSGTAARLAGLTAATLRVWEHRYGVVAPPRSPSGQRTYSMDDVQRLRLLKRLTLDGHAIGTLARLSVDALERLAAGGGSKAASGQRVVVVGLTVAQKLEGRLRPAAPVVFADLAEAEREVARCGAADVLVVQVASLHAAMPERVLALAASMPAERTVVVYAFGTEAAAAALRATGATVCREPVGGTELAAAIAASTPSRPPVAAPTTAAGPRRFSDAELVVLSESPSRVACECPRHLAEIVALLVGFERYSAECESRDARDADLHRHLHGIAGAARTLFEDALTRVAVEEGLAV